MATANVSGGEGVKITSIDQIYCSSILTAGIHGQLTFISVLNAILSITAFLGNALIFAALRKESSLHPPSKLLLRNLAATDLLVGLILQPLNVVFLISAVDERWDICRTTLVILRPIAGVLSAASFYTVTALSVDRLLALLLGLRYRHVVTLRRIYVVVIICWILPIVFSAMFFWNSVVARWYFITAGALCLLTSICSYTKIFLTLRHRQALVQEQAQQPNQGNSLNIARYRKAVSSALWLQLALVACYQPDSIVGALMANGKISSSMLLARHYTGTLIYLNSSLNPILYCWKIEEVKQAVKATIRKILCCLSN